MSKTLVLFDFDGTLSKKDTYPQFILFAKGTFVGLLGFVLFSPLIILYKLKVVSGSILKQKMTSYFFKGMDEADLKKKGDAFITALTSKGAFNTTIVAMMEEHLANSHEVCIVSASLDCWIEPFSRRRKVNFLCTELLFTEGKFSGNLKTPNCNGADKMRRIRERYDLKDYSSVIAYGNSSGDSEMFSLANKVNFVKQGVVVSRS